MASSQDPNLSLNYGWTLGESGWNTGMDANLKKLGALVFLNVLSATTTAPPGSPANGDRYIVPASATGAWAGSDGKLAVWNSVAGAWTYYTAKRGWATRANDTKQLWEHNGSAWQLPGSVYTQYADDAAAATGGVPVGGIYIKTASGALTVRLA